MDPPTREPNFARPASIVNWRRNLAALWLAEFMAIFGFALALPFLPLFLHRDLGISGQSQLAFWTGIVASASGFAMTITSPVWGALADRYGRQRMLLRAMLGGGLSVGLMGLSQNALQLTGLRFLQGAAAGTIGAATALVASETPREKVGWALGILSSSFALGNAGGPAIGGFAASLFGLRIVFLAGGALILVAMVPVLLTVREAPRGYASRTQSFSVSTALRDAPRGTTMALIALVGGQALLQSSYSACQQLFVLRLIQLNSIGVTEVAGIAFGAAGIATALAGITYSRAHRDFGYGQLSAIAAMVMSAAIIAVALMPTILLVVGAFIAASFLNGMLLPYLSSMVGLQAPHAIQATVYGFSASAIALGLGGGSLAGGLTASTAGITAGLLLAGSLAAALGLVLLFWARQPSR